MVKVAVLGAGPNGLASAVKIKEKYPKCEVVVISKEFTPNTTADGSGGMWHPYLIGNNSEELITKWGLETYFFLQDLWMKKTCNISIRPMYNLRSEERELTRPLWADAVHDYRILEGQELDYVSSLYSGRYIGGHAFTTFITHVPSLLTHLQHRFLASSGKLVPADVETLGDRILDDYDVIVNCTGLGARTLVPDDSVFAIRGQTHRANAPWINAAVIDVDAGLYILPNFNTCVLGGTSQAHDYNREINQHDKTRILEGCARLVPTLKNVEITSEWVGLRPGRDSVRLTSEARAGKLLIHNYGHGGSGLTLFWGCASDVLKLFEEHNSLQPESKL